MPTFNWGSAPGADHYNLIVIDTTPPTAGLPIGTNTIVINITTTSTSFKPGTAQALTPGHSYVWYVGAVSRNGLQSSYDINTPRTFSLAGLGTPTLTGPTGTVTPSAGYDMPTFTWSSAAGADHYYLYVVDNTTHIPVINNPNVGNGTSFTPGAAQALTPGDNFTWYVIAFSTNSQAYSFVPSGQTFTLTQFTPSTLTSPGGTINSVFPTFIWTGVTGANHYDIVVLDTTTPMFTIAVRNQNATGTSWTTGTALLSGHHYIWYVGAVSTNGSDEIFGNGLSFAIS
jgi:hypothetical protein